MTDVTNPRAVAGDNASPDFAALVAENLERDYAEIARTIDELLEEARNAPKEVNDDDTMGALAKIVKRLRDATSRLQAFHSKEKEPHLRAGQAVDKFFFGLWEKCARRNRTDKAGAADILMARIDDYNQRKLAEERRKRDEELRRAREEEQRIAEARRIEEQKARDAEAAANRARNAEKIEQHNRAAALAQAKADEEKARQDLARDQRQEAEAAAAAKPSDLMRTRVSDDVLSTMAQEGYAEVTDYALLPADPLWDFVKDEHKAQALRAWAKVTQHKRQLPGAVVGKRNKSVIR